MYGLILCYAHNMDYTPAEVGWRRTLLSMAAAWGPAAAEHCSMLPPPRRHRQRQAAQTGARGPAAAKAAAHRYRTSRPRGQRRQLLRRQQWPRTALATTGCSLGQLWVTGGRGVRRCCWPATAIAALFEGKWSGFDAGGRGCAAAVSPCAKCACNAIDGTVAYRVQLPGGPPALVCLVHRQTGQTAYKAGTEVGRATSGAQRILLADADALVALQYVAEGSVRAALLGAQHQCIKFGPMPIVLGSIHEREACQRNAALLQGCLIVVRSCAHA